MKLKVKEMHISTGGPFVVILNEEDARHYDLHFEDRVKLWKNKLDSTAILDIADSSIIPKGHIGLFKELAKDIHSKTGDYIQIRLDKKPDSVHYIKKKLLGKRLTDEEINQIIFDVVEHRLSDVELTYFVSGCFANGMTLNETISLTRAIANNGSKLKLKQKIVMDKHCIGGVCGNRTTIVLVPILAAAGLTIPKTSSRSISSPAGTADTVEVLTEVTIPLPKMRSIIRRTNGCMVWGGGLDLASADDKLIRVRHPLSLDPEGMLLASVLAKKLVVSSNHVLIDIPTGRDTKIPNKRSANKLKKEFEEIGKRFGMKIRVIITDGSQPIGNGIGPALEARDSLWLFEQDSRAPLDLKEKGLMMAGIMLEMSGKAKPGQGIMKAKEILESGEAHKKLLNIIKAQGGKIYHANEIKIGKFEYTVKSERKGVVTHINNKLIAKIARLAGAPEDQGAGIYLYKHVKSFVEKNGDLYTIYSQSPQKLSYTKEMLRVIGTGIVIEKKK